MYQARFTKPLSISLEKEVYNRLKALTDRERVSMAHFVRYYIEQALDQDDQENERKTDHDE